MATKKNTAIKRGDKEYSYYRITRTVGHEWKDGRKVPIKKQFTGTSKGNAEQKYKKYLEDQAAQKLSEKLEVEAIKAKTFGEYAEEFTYAILPSLSYAKGTKEQYAAKYKKHVSKSSLAAMPISSVTARTIQDFYNSLQTSSSVLSGINKWMAAFYRWIALSEYGPNVMSSVTTPKKELVSSPNEITVWEPEEMDAIFKAAKTYRYRLMIYIMYYAGLRISECLGLQYDDIKDGLLYVNRQYYRGYVVPPKHNSCRTIPVHRELLAALEEHRILHEREMIKYGYHTDYIFTSRNGSLLDYHNVRTSFARFYKRNGIPEKKLHAYRATFCTELCRAGVPLEVASKLMGHKSIEVTSRHYALVKHDVQIDAIKRLPVFR